GYREDTPTPARSMSMRPGAPSSSTGRSTAPATHGREAVPPAHIPIRAGLMPRGRCCAFSWSIRSPHRDAIGFGRRRRHLSGMSGFAEPRIEARRSAREREFVGIRSERWVMRFVLGIIVGVLLTIGLAYLSDASISPSTNASGQTTVE